MQYDTQLSLLWPRECDSTVVELSAETQRDLDVSTLAAALAPSPRYTGHISQILTKITADTRVISFRQAILRDMLAHVELVEEVGRLLPGLEEIGQFQPSIRRSASIFQVAERLAELDTFAQTATALAAALQRSENIQSTGLAELRALTLNVIEDPLFRKLVEALPQMLKAVRQVGSVAIGVNLDHRLRPVAATLLSIDEEKYTAASVLDRIFGRENPFSGIVQLHSVPQGGPGADGYPSQKPDPLMVPLFRDLAQVLEKVSRPIAAALHQFEAVNVARLAHVAKDLAFYVGAAKLQASLASMGLATTLPDILPLQTRELRLNGMYNVKLALNDRIDPATIVANDISFNEEGRILVLTGPNGGGKTTFLQGVGLCQLLAQAGVFVPASYAAVAPVDCLFTHYQVEERPETQSGRFGEEAQRLRMLFQHATGASLILLNEAFASTSAAEGLYLAQDLLRIFRMMGARVVFATHLLELGARADEMNRDTPGDSTIVSVVASHIDEHGVEPHPLLRTFTITRRPPMGRSYARELAARFGVSHDQINALLQERGVLKE